MPRGSRVPVGPLAETLSRIPGASGARATAVRQPLGKGGKQVPAPSPGFTAWKLWLAAPSHPTPTPGGPEAWDEAQGSVFVRTRLRPSNA